AARLRNYQALDAEVAAWTSSLPVAEVIAGLEAAGVAGAEVRTPDGAIHDPRVLARKEVVALEHPQYGAVQEVYGPGVPIRFSRTPAELPPGVARLGEDNERVYGEMLGFSAEELERLRAEGAI